MTARPAFPHGISQEEQTWIRTNTPRLQCPDPLIQDVYDFRWAVFRRHLHPTEAGWVISEFSQPGPGGKWGTINAAAGHHLYEGRWLRDPQYLDDYTRFWFEHPEAKPHLYSEWLANAVWSRACVTGDWDLPRRVLPGLVRNYEAWESDSLHPAGLFWVHDLADAMEVSISGDGFRPSINSYQYGNALAISRIAARTENDLAGLYAAKAATLKGLIHERLWDRQDGFFKTWPLSDNSYEAYVSTAGNGRRLPAKERNISMGSWDFADVPRNRNVRELIGFLPWYFDMAEDSADHAWTQLVEPGGFWGAYGLRTAEKRHPRYGFPFRLVKGRFACQWNGPSWPFATSQTLTALARILQARPAKQGVSPSSYFQLLKLYAASHCAKGANEHPRFWLDENLDPDTGEWLMLEWRRANAPEKTYAGRDYNHSTFCDLILSGLLGICPDEKGTLTMAPLLPEGAWPWFSVTGLRIWGRDIAIFYDSDGTRFAKGRGLRLEIDGNPGGQTPTLGPLCVQLT